MPKRLMLGWAGRICLWIKARHGGEGTGQGASRKWQAKRQDVLRLRREGRGIAKALRLAPGTVQTILKEARQGAV